MNITIRLAEPADAPDMAEVFIRSWEKAYKDIIPICLNSCCILLINVV